MLCPYSGSLCQDATPNGNLLIRSNLL